MAWGGDKTKQHDFSERIKKIQSILNFFLFFFFAPLSQSVASAKTSSSVTQSEKGECLGRLSIFVRHIDCERPNSLERDEFRDLWIFAVLIIRRKKLKPRADSRKFVENFIHICFDSFPCVRNKEVWKALKVFKFNRLCPVKVQRILWYSNSALWSSLCSGNSCSLVANLRESSHENSVKVNKNDIENYRFSTRSFCAAKFSIKCAIANQLSDTSANCEHFTCPPWHFRLKVWGNLVIKKLAIKRENSYLWTLSCKQHRDCVAAKKKSGKASAILENPFVSSLCRESDEDSSERVRSF